ncbi:MAG: ABC transporter ATP-binding protein [Alphaproteobacteria bacterium]|nr:ABC transporter ATP-binding protein [Alphaproteobacteria bacterium]
MKKNRKTTLLVRNLSKSFGDIHAVNNVNFTAYDGDVIALLGPNGAGKSTLINMIAGYISPTAGNIEVLGKDIAEASLFAKENIGFLSEGAPLYPDMSVKMFLNYMASLRGLPKSAVEKAAQTANINEVLKQKNETLSKGYQRRVGFAQSILHNPPILLLDEPTDGLDPNQKDYMRRLIKEMSQNKTIIISTHLLEEAETVCNRIIVLDKGVIRADGDLKQILKQTGCKNLSESFRVLTKQEA